MIKYIILACFVLNVCHCLCGRSASQQQQQQDADCYVEYLARENVVRMGLEGGCELPKPQIIYPNDDMKMYMPRGKLIFFNKFF